MARIQVLTDDKERELFRAQANREGRSLSEWLREAARERLARATPSALRTGDELDAFFEEIDRRHAHAPPEEDWSEHKVRIMASRTTGLP